MSSIHGHEVMEMMLESEQGYTRESLIEAITQRFGSDARFHTCSATDLDAAALITLLEERGKFVPCKEGFSTSADKICQH